MNQLGQSVCNGSHLDIRLDELIRTLVTVCAAHFLFPVFHSALQSRVIQKNEPMGFRPVGLNFGGLPQYDQHQDEQREPRFY